MPRTRDPLRAGARGAAGTAMSVALALYSLIALYLIPNVVLSSLKPRQELIDNTLGFPRVFTLENYRVLLVEDGFHRYFLNSLVILLLSITLLLLVASLTAYGLTRFRFRGRGLLGTYFLLGMMFPIQLGILPIFIIMRGLHLANTFPGMALLYSANLSLPVFIFSRFFRTLPPSLYESATIDGAREIDIYARIMLPLSKPVLATVGLLDSVIIWNDFYLPLVFLTRRAMRPLTLGIFWYMTNFLENWHLVFSAVTLALAPIVVVFFLFSRQLVEGLTAGALKE
jgi:raffinose/stachyose/melibiose transport system permease protein